VRTYALVFLISFLSCCCDPSFGQSAEKDPQAVLEIGGAASRSLTKEGGIDEMFEMMQLRGHVYAPPPPPRGRERRLLCEPQPYSDCQQAQQ
jgi:hypothetical protein